MLSAWTANTLKRVGSTPDTNCITKWMHFGIRRHSSSHCRRPPHSFNEYSLQMCVCVIISKHSRDIVPDADYFVTAFSSVWNSFLSYALIIEEIKYSFELTKWTVSFALLFALSKCRTTGEKERNCALFIDKKCSSATFSDKYDKNSRLSHWIVKVFLWTVSLRTAYKEQRIKLDE